MLRKLFLGQGLKFIKEAFAFQPLDFGVSYFQPQLGERSRLLFLFQVDGLLAVLGPRVPAFLSAFRLDLLLAAAVSLPFPLFFRC